MRPPAGLSIRQSGRTHATRPSGRPNRSARQADQPGRPPGLGSSWGQKNFDPDGNSRKTGLCFFPCPPAGLVVLHVFRENVYFRENETEAIPALIGGIMFANSARYFGLFCVYTVTFAAGLAMGGNPANQLREQLNLDLSPRAQWDLTKACLLELYSSRDQLEERLESQERRIRQLEKRVGQTQDE